MKIRKIWIPVFLVVILAFAAGTGFYKGDQMKEEEAPIRAMYIPLGENGHLMIGQKNGDTFTVDMPETILDKDGKTISWQELKRGNIIDIYGDGIMLESYPGQYPGVSKIQVISEGKPSDADKYQDIIDEVWTPKAPSELPCLNVEYTQPDWTVSAVTMQGGYSWTYKDEEGKEQKKTADSFKLTNLPELPVMDIEKAADMTLSFDVQPVKVTAAVYPSGILGKEASKEEGEILSVEADEDGSFVLKNAQKEKLYIIRGEWENGWSEYGFIVK